MFNVQGNAKQTLIEGPQVRGDLSVAILAQEFCLKINKEGHRADSNGGNLPAFILKYEGLIERTVLTASIKTS